ncbi:HAD-superfamily hydrolase [Pelomyxa schiedti]|nr:HAD-superfamily hydrolase [Pelomyxa schiedti]KAH3760064.1 HAD-superfamily hydrolase [Pelomyxa schiedti]
MARLEPSAVSKFGLALDLDGVLLRDGVPMPRVLEAVRRLTGQNGTTSRVPLVFVSNNGGLPERDYASVLSSTLQFNVHENQVVLSHTPMRKPAAEFTNRKVLVVARNEAATKLPPAYGLTKFISLTDFACAHPQLWPLKTYPPFLAHLMPSCLFDETPVEGIFIFQAPDDWGEAIQIICDLVLGNGSITTPQDVSGVKPQIPIFLANPDVVYQGDHHVPRFTVGAFLMCLRTMYKYASGRDLEVKVYGKPDIFTYKYVEESLQQQADTLGQKLEVIYAIGDNPSSDIQGADNASLTSNYSWFTILTRGGCFHGQDNDPRFPAKAVVTDFSDALSLVFQRESYSPSKTE